MKIRLSNGRELSPIAVKGAPATIQGTRRDALSFIFDTTTESIVTLDEVFTDAACENITVIGNDGSESVYNGYTIRGEIKKASVLIHAETPNSAAIYEDRITVVMGQRTYMETKMAELTARLTVESN